MAGMHYGKVFPTNTMVDTYRCLDYIVGKIVCISALSLRHGTLNYKKVCKATTTNLFFLQSSLSDVNLQCIYFTLSGKDFKSCCKKLLIPIVA